MSENILEFPDMVTRQWAEIFEPRLREVLSTCNLFPEVIERVLDRQRQAYLKAGKPPLRIQDATPEEVVAQLNQYIFDMTWSLLWDLGTIEAQLMKQETL
jgi:hypothetical protein